MLQRRIHCVVVWHEPATASDPQLWGVVSDLDLVKVAATEDVGARTASGSAATPALMVTPEETVRRAAQLMAEHEVTHLVVVDGDEQPRRRHLDARRRQGGQWDPRLAPAV